MDSTSTSVLSYFSKNIQKLSTVAKAQYKFVQRVPPVHGTYYPLGERYGVLGPVHWIVQVLLCMAQCTVQEQK